MAAVARATNNATPTPTPMCTDDGAGVDEEVGEAPTKPGPIGLMLGLENADCVLVIERVMLCTGATGRVLSCAAIASTGMPPTTAAADKNACTQYKARLKQLHN